MSKFPPIFLKFLEDIGSDIHYYEHKIPRYIRIRDTSKLAEIQQELDIKETWLKDFYSLDAEKKIASTHCLKNGWIYGMDISSGLAVVALELQKNEHVLDICCAPGTKLVMAGELVSEGSVTGVDLSKHRLHTCKSMVQRASLQRVRLFLEDGTTFDCSPPCRIGPNVIYDYRQPKKLKTDIFHATRLLRNNPLVLIEDHLYDKVMVDAECTHDGSIAHIDKYIKNGWDQFEENFMNPDRLENLETLQRKLLENGFRLLKPGGILVYSTCSVSRKQNEDIISWFLKNHQNASLEPVPGADKIPQPRKEYHIKHCVRLDPEHSNTSGFFLARIRKAVV